LELSILVCQWLGFRVEILGEAEMKGRLVAAAALAAIVGCGGGSTIGGLDAEAVYTISLTQAAEVPAPKPTTASGSATIVVYSEKIDYELRAQSIISVTMAHIHNGAPGVAGPIVVTLFNQQNNPVSPNGVFASGSLTAQTLPAGVTLESLKTLLASGGAYVNVHTSGNPSGEIRGQVK
jgi:hypothetical protein